MKEKFLDYGFSFKESNVVFIGVKIGKTHELTLKKLREASNFISSFDLSSKKNLMERIRPFDIGDVKSKSFNFVLKKIIENKKTPVIVSQAHLISYFTSVYFRDNIFVVSFDAHADCKDSYLDEKIIELDFGYKFTERFNDSTWFRRSWEEGIKGVLVGIRALDEDEFEFIEKEKIPYFSSEQIKKQIKKVEKNIRKFTKKKDILISLDIDVFDPSIAPAVHYPEPNGILFEHFESIVKSINGRIVGIDLTCVNSFEGKNYVTEFLAIRSLFSIFSKLTF